MGQRVHRRHRHGAEWRIAILRAALPVASAFAFAGVLAPVAARAADIEVDNGTPLVVQSPTQLTADLLIVGDQHSGQALTIQNGGQVRAISTIAGLGTSGNFSNNIIITVTGAGSLLQNIDPLQSYTGAALIVGNFGTGNQLIVSGGGHVTISHVSGPSSPDDVVVGYQLGADSNKVTVTGAGSQLSTTDSTLYVGLNSSRNELDILSGGLVSSKNVRIGGGTGGSASADSNTVLVDGAVSAWNISGTLRVGSNGTNSMLTISNGGAVQVTGNTFLGYDATSTGNRIVVTGANSQLSAVDVTIGRLGNTNTILVEAGGTLSANSITLANTGKLQVGSGAGAGTVAVTAGIVGDASSSVVFDHNQSNYVFGATLAGALNVVQSGSGATILSGANTYTGATTVSGGMLVVTGSSLSSGYTVTGGTLAGTATLSAVDVQNGGTLAPGLSGAAGGTLHISGNLVMASAASYLVNIAPAAASLTTVTGSATLSGTFAANGTGGAYTQGQTYTVLTSTGARSGAFSALTVNGSFGSMMPTLSYDAHDVFLTLVPGNLAANLPAGTPQNVVGLANAITAANTGTPPLAFQNLFQLSPTELANALSRLSGETATGAQGATFGLTSSFLSLLSGSSGGAGNAGPALPFAPERADAFPPDVALAYASVLKAPPKGPTVNWNAWGAAFGGSNRTGGDPAGAGSHDVTAHAGAFAAGVDYRVSPDTVVGFALAGGGTAWDLSAGLGGGRSDTFMAGLRGFTRLGPAYLSGGLSYASSWMSTSRTIAAAGTDTLSASFNAQSFGGRLEGGYRVPAALLFSATPYAAVQAQSFRSPAYGESGTLGAPDPMALAYASQTATAVRTELGSRFDRDFAQANSSIDLFGRVAWAHDWQSNPNLAATFIGLPAASFVVNGAAPPADLALLTAGAEWRRRDGWAFLARLDGEFAGRAQTYTGTARVKYFW